ncbi:hypothetical protein OKW41_006024 [Paraburkholderia sp. UCT70]|uniref:hypothetical protein n=1 Tax=Paraburkholderia sp. UCT70 TaxID=2991068 RepID=UPI003D2499AF
MTAEKPVGQLFSHTYLERGAPASDSPSFRERLAVFLDKRFEHAGYELSSYLAMETGYVSAFACQRWSETLQALTIAQLLDVITLVWRFCQIKRLVSLDSAWIGFVARALSEGNLGYRLDPRCGVHYLVDSEFEHNRVSMLRALESARYAAVRHEFEAAHDYLTASDPDTKAAVKSIFEAMEILTRLMVTTKNLNKYCAQNQLKDLALKAMGTDPATEGVIRATFDALGEWIDGIHLYRHGQSTQTPIAPPLPLAVHIVSMASTYIRLLVDVDLATLANPAASDSV